jgi:hypothetical protein
LSKKPDQYALARKLLVSEAAALLHDEWGAPAATRTDIVSKPPTPRKALAAIPDLDDPTLRMSPERVLALLKTEDMVPEPLEPTPGHSPTRVLDAAEVSEAQRLLPESSMPVPPSKSTVKGKFEIVENLPARPPRAPKVPAEFSAIKAHTVVDIRTGLVRLKARLLRATGLLLMALTVFSATYLVTKALRDERARSRSWDAVVGFYHRAGSALGLGADATETKPKPNAEVSKAPAEPRAQPSSPTPRETPPRVGRVERAEPSEAKPPVVRLEDLKPLEDCASPDCKSAPKNATTKRTTRGRSPR